MICTLEASVLVLVVKHVVLVLKNMVLIAYITDCETSPDFNKVCCATL